jgi:anti-repressor protein
MEDEKGLSLFSDGFLANCKKLTTVKEIMDSMGCPRQTVLDSINRVLLGKMEKGEISNLNEAELALVSEDLKKAHNTDLASTRTVTTMSSREIAELTDKRHDHVIRDVSILNDSYVEMSLPKVGESEYKNERGRFYKEYNLTKMQCFDLLTGYSTPLRIKVNRRWEELENANRPVVPRTYGEALIEAGRLAIENEKLLLENKEMFPKADFYDRVTESEDTFGMGAVAKILNIKGFGRNNLIKYLRDEKIIMKSNEPYQKYLHYFKAVEVETNVGLKLKPVAFQKGVDFILKRIG